MTLFYRFALFFWNSVFNIAFRRKIINPEKVHVKGGYLVVANHTSFLDPTLVGSCFDEALYFLARKSLFKKGIGGWAMRKVNSIPINQERPEYSSMKKIIQLAKAGEKILIFPEGERTYDGELKETGQPGVGLLIAKSRVPILPTRHFGAYEALPRGATFPKLKKLTVVIGDPIDLNDFIDNSGLGKKELYQALSDKAMEAIAALEIPGEEKS